MKSVLSATVILAALFVSEPVMAQSATDDAAMLAFRNGAFAEALTGWMRAAAAGDGSAARYVGVLYDTGEGVSQDQAAALHWYRRAAELGDVPAMFNVAVCFDAGRGADRDPVQAAYWYRQAASHRFGRAEYNLALMQEQGDGVPRDRRAAASMFRAALQDGIQAARLHLPESAFRAHGVVTAITRTPLPGTVPEEPSRAPQPAAAGGVPDSAFVSAQAALLGRSPGAASQAAALFARAAREPGPAASMARYDLAWCYQSGIGVPADQQRAYRIFVQVAAETDDPVLGKLAQAAAEHAALSPVTAPNATHPAVPER